MSTGDIDFSFAGWLKPESFSGVHAFISKDNTSQREYGVFISDNSGFKIRFYVFDSGGNSTSCDHTTAMSTGTWYFVAFGHSAALNQTWVSVDGGAAVTASHTTGVKDGTAAFWFGNTENTSRYYDGLMDEWGFWKRDIRADLTELYNAGSGRDYAYITGGGGGGTTGEEFQKHDPQARRFSRRQSGLIAPETNLSGPVTTGPIQADSPQPSRARRRQMLPQWPAPLLSGPSLTDCGLILEDGGAILTETAGDPIALEACAVADDGFPFVMLRLPTRPAKQAVPYQ